MANPLGSGVILRAALTLVDERGLGELSMRTLATRLDVRAASLYYHVRDKAALLQMIADSIATEVGEPLDPAMPWRDLLQTLADSLHSALRKHPGAAAVVAMQHVSPEVAAELSTRLLTSMRRTLPVSEDDASFLVQSLFVLVTGLALAERGNVPEPPAAPQSYYDDWFALAVSTFLAGIESTYGRQRTTARGRRAR